MKFAKLYAVVNKDDEMEKKVSFVAADYQEIYNFVRQNELTIDEFEDMYEVEETSVSRKDVDELALRLGGVVDWKY